ncbi:MAG: hypothetical protein RMY29_019005, partial [Nostoc sp. CreGUA01]
QKFDGVKFEVTNSIVYLPPSFFFRLLPSALCLLPCPNQDHQKLPRTKIFLKLLFLRVLCGSAVAYGKPLCVYVIP